MGNVEKFAQRMTKSDPRHDLAIAVKTVLSSLAGSSRIVAATVASLDKSLRSGSLIKRFHLRLREALQLLLEAMKYKNLHHAQ
jgi:hypothetical protein